VGSQDPRRPTDALANERTYLAYLRTALAFVAFGFVIARFSLFGREISAVAHITVPRSSASIDFGAEMALLGVVVGAYGTYRYLATDIGLRRGEIKAMPSSAAILGGLAVAVIGIGVAVSLWSFR
jgi:putative membrane protein